MFLSKMLLIPWIVFGFRNPNNSFFGLRQSKNSLLFLVVVEAAFFITLIMLLGERDPNVAGSGSFAWHYMYIYEKGIFPLLIPAEIINGNLGDYIDNNYKIFFFVTALLMDYLILKFISPAVFNFKKIRRNSKFLF